MSNIIRQIVRGCGTLPYVGEHPGTETYILFVFIGGVAGVSAGGLRGFLGGMAIMAVCLCPLYFYGAYGRANLSDRRVARNGLPNPDE